MPPETILIVDDDPICLAIASLALQSAGFETRTAADGMEALDLLHIVQPALILSDIQMPHMDGFEFLEEMRRNAEWRDIPVVVVTARDLTDADRSRLNGGVERIIQKTNCDDMLREVRSVLTKCVERQRSRIPVET